MVFPQRYGAVAASAGDESFPLVRPRAHDRSSFRTVAIGVSTLALGAVGMLGVAMNRGVDYSVSSSTSLVQRALGYALPPAPKREITFKVHVCGVPTQVWNPYVPFDVCRVKLVGCPGGGSSCKHWRYADGLEMQPTDGQMNTFTITTSEYAAGDVFGFAVVKNGCKVSDEISCEQDSLGSCKEKDICDHRYDSGTNGAKNDITCWEGSSVCSSNSPFIPEASNAACFTQMGEFFNRVVPDSGSTVEYVWGTCQTNVAESEKGACAARTTCGSRDGEHENDDHESRSDGFCDATDDDFGAITGACTQSCGTGNADCDKTCQAAVDADSSLELDCVIGGDGNTKCSCSNVGGGTKDECPDYKSGYKCCTCKKLKKRPVIT
jgi:hypothetical protein